MRTGPGLLQRLAKQKWRASVYAGNVSTIVYAGHAGNQSAIRVEVDTKTADVLLRSMAGLLGLTVTISEQSDD